MPIASPCIGICIVDSSSVCIGCRRSLDEIARWSQATDQQKRDIIEASRSRGPEPMIPLQTIQSHVREKLTDHEHVAWYDLAVEICRIQNTLKPKTSLRRTIVFGNEQVMAECPTSLFSNTFCPDIASVTPSGTLSTDLAMSRSQFMAAWKIGTAQSDAAACDGAKLVSAIFGDQRDRCAALSLVSVLAQGETLPSTNISVQRAIAFCDREDWKGLATEIATLPIVAMAGLIVRSGQQGLIIIIDNLVSAAAALLAEKIYPGTARMMVAIEAAEGTGYEDALSALRLQLVAIDRQSLPEVLDSIAFR